MSSISKEDYIKAIYELNARNRCAVKSKEIADTLSVSKPAITDMIKKLIRDGLVAKDSGNSIVLTTEGERNATQLIRKHRLWEMFLHEVLNLSWEEIHDEAENLEHSTSDFLIDKIDEYLNHPKVDPHGAPIPDKNGNIHKKQSFDMLADKDVGAYRVKSIYDKEREFIEALNRMQIYIGTSVELVKHHQFDDSILIRTNEKEHLITKQFASKIFVTET